jgi:hypothetical protein
LWSRQHADLHIAKTRKPLGEHAQRHGFAHAGRAGDHREATFAGKLLDAPAERFRARRHLQRLNRDVRRERIKFEPVQGEQLLIHGFSPS